MKAKGLTSASSDCLSIGDWQVPTGWHSGGCAVGGDVSRPADVARLFKEVDTALEGSTFWSTNAGVFRFGAFAETAEESFHIRSHRRPIRWQDRWFTHLQRAIETLTKWLALALAPVRIRVNAIAPGHPETEGNIAAGL